MVCLSYNGTIAHMKSLTREFDSDVLEWSGKLAENLQVFIHIIYCVLCNFTYPFLIGIHWQTFNQGCLG